MFTSVVKALRVLEMVSTHPQGISAKCLSDALAVPVATMYRIVRTMQHEGWLESTDGLYRLGTAAAPLFRVDHAGRAVAEAGHAQENSP
ncbi:helix-turn-helix domain-containing protein [Streptomyces sp. G1]|uniref:helix-turn-helix domain-containing protein n=1 Tax=Streptomyces sp. G1 TaxID=361572 RepID=UPI00202EBFC2|nr:helix-turn-helix domain-containing protein [Streptomyces sp. G1]MCM1965110.1 helix-turn-helix domain-containing protein [Streptomyces sp. G1]